MADYIERESVIRHGFRYLLPNGKESPMVVFVSDVEKAPAADVRPVVHAEWIEDGYYNEPCVCSHCGNPCRETVMGKPRWRYCPLCGAEMDGDGE